ncbi:MAG: hypothetical protein QOI79_1504 [Mycobacterium sp.]|jgi:hypothetical protein|nr:hypothetical protein [Mycobacterium sp.]
MAEFSQCGPCLPATRRPRPCSMPLRGARSVGISVSATIRERIGQPRSATTSSTNRGWSWRTSCWPPPIPRSTTLWLSHSHCAPRCAGRRADTSLTISGTATTGHSLTDVTNPRSDAICRRRRGGRLQFRHRLRRRRVAVREDEGIALAGVRSNRGDPIYRRPACSAGWATRKRSHPDTTRSGNERPISRRRRRVREPDRNIQIGT